ncbi:MULTISPECIES: cytochrome b5 domain-containing protein [unclassified Legionella]|uniref:cytochrome b5 domain-containing protein n=1 Tax=unclassified Legionella TaxID=2622702 RepID=UPI001055309A|nr:MULTISPECIES: cytochrome b5 domain-containing protein [unclassified Legionella]MDI9818111.1 cytochrome b5 domain-containing protein [Legionella sp. PL877]
MMSDKQLSLTPTELVLQNYRDDIFGFHGHMSYDYEFFPSQPLPQHLPSPWDSWENAITKIPHWYRSGTVCQNLAALPVLPADNLQDEYLTRANIILGSFALGFKFCWEQMNESNQQRNQQIKAQIEQGNNILAPIEDSVVKPWRKIWQKMGRHRSCVESDMFVSNFVYKGEQTYRPELINSKNTHLLIPFFLTRTEHRFWFSVIELCARFPGISATVNLQQAMQLQKHSEVEQILNNLAELWFSIVEEILTTADIGVSAIDWGNTTARWTAALFPGEEGFSGMFSPAWHIMDQLVSRRDYDSYLGKIMQKTRLMLPKGWQEYIDAVGQSNLQTYIDKYSSQHSGLKTAYNLLLESYQYFFRSHRRKVFAFEYQSMLSGRSETNGGIKADSEEPGWDLVNLHLKDSARERPAKLAAHNKTYSHSWINPYLVKLDMSKTGWHAGDRVDLELRQHDGETKSIVANVCVNASSDEYLLLWSDQFENIETILKISKISGEFIRQPTKPEPVFIIADMSCAGMAMDCCLQQHALNAKVIIESNSEVEEYLAPLNVETTNLTFVNDIEAYIAQATYEIKTRLDSQSHFYFFGAVNFIRRANTAFRVCIKQITSCVNETYRQLREEKRLHLAAIYQPMVPTGENSLLHAWDVAESTDPNHCMRVILHNQVLNITEFLPIHIGGENILEMMAGTDITREFEIAHTNGVKVLGIPNVFVEGKYVLPKKDLEPLTKYIFQLVRYVNAFVVTQNDVWNNHAEDTYILGNTLLHSLRQLPEENIWGSVFSNYMKFNKEYTADIAEYCNNKHQAAISIVEEYMNGKSDESGKLLLTKVRKNYEDFGRYWIKLLCYILKKLTDNNNSFELLDAEENVPHEFLWIAKITIGTCSKNQCN